MNEAKQGGSAHRPHEAEVAQELARLRDDFAKAQKNIRTLARSAQRAEQERKRQQDIFDLVCASGSDLLILASQGGKIGFVSASALEMLGVQPAELQGRRLHDLCRSDDGTVVSDFLKALANEAGTGQATARIQLRHKSGSFVEFDIHATRIPHPNAQSPEAFLLLRKPADAGRTPIAQGDLAASLAHELNQPLTAISLTARACARLVKSKRSTTEDLEPAIENLAIQAERANELVRRIRQIVSGGKPRRAATDLNAVVRESLAQLNVDLQSAGIRTRVALADSVRPVYADPVQIGQVISNLVRNAMEAMQAMPADSRRLTLATAPNSSSVEVIVSDTGPGLASDLLPRLFQPFQTTKPKGMGLGLALSRSIAQAHGGRLWLAEESKSGATFHFSLPYYGEHP